MRSDDNETSRLFMIDVSAPDLNDKSILVTGGTGSFGKAFARHVLVTYKPRRLVIFSRDEQKQWDMAQELSPQKYGCLRYFIGDVRDAGRLDMAMRGIDCVIHAAALKQVSTAEYNPFECIHTNVIGAENVAQAAIRNQVQRTIALSTDKAANPINLYGASKLASDKIFVAAGNLSGSLNTRFAVVRYGNVIGSRGSVIPFMRDLIAKGAESLPITDPRMTRFWITLNQGVRFVLSCMNIARGGEIFVPKIPSMRIVDLAKALAPHMPHHIVGIRPGEKLHEVMVTEDDARSTLELDDRYIIEPTFHWWTRRSFAEDGAKQAPADLRYASDTNSQWLDAARLREMLAEPAA
ncbi:MAG: UDP-N-acetylglucosamine 4,6-dehydratase (inverting) [Dongiaceae bacterium]